MAERIGALDARGLLGEPGRWPAPLQAATGQLLRAPLPMVLLWGARGVMVYNDAYAAFAGSRHPGLLGQPVREGWPEVAQFNEHVMRTVMAGTPLVYRDQPLVLQRGDEPEKVWLDLYYAPVSGEHGKPAGVMATVVDTTERVRANIALRDSEARLSALVDATADAVYRMSPDWASMVQLDGKGFVNDSRRENPDWLSAYVHHDDHARVQAAIEQAIHARAPYQLEHRVLRVDGSTGWTFSRAVPVLDEQGQVREWFGAASDISERKANEAALRANQERLLFLDVLGRTTSQSSDADQILRLTTELLGRHLGASVCAYADVEADGNAFTVRGNWHTHQARSIVGQYRLEDFGALAVRNLTCGQPLIINDSERELPADAVPSYQALGARATVCMPLLKQGKLTALMAVHDQLPRQWQAQELALLAEVVERSWAHIERVRSAAAVRAGEQRFLQSLETQVAERTASLARSEENIRRTEAALQQAQKMEALGNLTGGIAHDFNNLLMAVLGNLELLRKRLPADPSLQRLADNASAGAQRGAALIERMLAFARRQALRRQRLDPVALVHGMTELMQRTLGPTVTIHSELPAQLPWVDTDPNQLEAALLNLAVNARDAMCGHGRITLSGHVAVLAEGGLPHVCLAVGDTGAGMDERTLKRATEPFFTTKGVGEGSGLGLSMVLGLAEQSGGTLRLLSSPGQGTTAQVWLPACPPQLQPPEIANAPELPPLPALHALVVDDDALVRDSTSALLASLGHRVTLANSAEQALGLLQAGTFDLLLTDHAMPVRTGTQLAEKVRLHYPALPVLLVSGYSDVVAPRELRLVYLAKPFSRQQLAQAVHQALRTSEVCDE